MDDNELNRLFDMTDEGEGNADKGKPARKSIFARFKKNKADKKSSKKGLLDDVLDFSDDDEDIEEAEEVVEETADKTLPDPAAEDQDSKEETEAPSEAETPAEKESETEEEAAPEDNEGEVAEEADAESVEEDKADEEEEAQEEESSEPAEEELEEEKAAAVSHKAKYRLKKPDVDIPMPSRRTILAIILVVLLVGIGLCLAFLPAFRVKYMKIDGNTVVSDQEILEATKLKYNAHLLAGVSGNILDVLKLNYGKTEERIKRENPYIRDIDISVTLPSTVNIRIDERAKISYVKTPDGYAALDKEGTVLELSSEPGEVRPVISGLLVDSATLGKKCTIENITDYQRAIIVLGAILQVDNSTIENEYHMFANTEEIRILPSGYMFLTIYTPLGSLLQVKLNSTESITDDMTWLHYALVSGGFENLPDGSLDMTGDEVIYRPY
ncbi:MAG: FtsQ-type POTRA domain-containing protein [Clostridiales bacterium]|nr:FtsQ-type POTRA domain-containing protein [Clostridiales bacterium]